MFNEINFYLILFQIRRQARLRREYIYRKSIEDRERTIQEKKQKLKHSLDGNFLFKKMFFFPLLFQVV